MVSTLGDFKHCPSDNALHRVDEVNRRIKQLGDQSDTCLGYKSADSSFHYDSDHGSDTDGVTIAPHIDLIWTIRAAKHRLKLDLA